MSKNHYHKCLHIGHLQATRKKGEMYICLRVAGTIKLVLLCPECYRLVKRGKTTEIMVYKTKNKIRTIKKYPGDTSPTFFELLMS